MKYTMINMPLHQHKFILHLEFNIITQRFFQQVIKNNIQVKHQIKDIQDNKISTDKENYEMQKPLESEVINE